MFYSNEDFHLPYVEKIHSILHYRLPKKAQLNYFILEKEDKYVQLLKSRRMNL